MRRLLVLLLGLAVTGCADRSEPDGSGRSQTAADPTSVELISLTSGDRACYVVVRPAGEAPREEFGAFDVCEQTALVGQNVVLTVDPAADIAAASCEGDPECPDRESVRLITAIEPAD